MYIILFLLLLLLVGWLARTLLYKTYLPGVAVLLIIILLGIVAAAVLYWAAVYLSIFAFQRNDLITW